LNPLLVAACVGLLLIGRESLLAGRAASSAFSTDWVLTPNNCGVLPICRNFWRPNALLFNLAFLKDAN
jgi:hypothetical protein